MGVNYPTQRVKKAARPWMGLIFGLLLGLAVAVLLQQAGVWPLDQLLLWGSLGVFGLIGILMSAAGRARVSGWVSVPPLILAVALVVFGALGLADANQSGELNGGCLVHADSFTGTPDNRSPVDSTDVTDTSRSDPFDVERDGGLEWVATSPVPFMDHTWKIYADVGGFAVPLAEGGDPNEGGSPANGDVIPDVSAYAEQVIGAPTFIAGGTFIVGGDIKPMEGPGCDGFAFVRILTDPLETLASKIAAALAAIALLVLLLLAFNRYRMAEVVPGDAGEAAADDVIADASDSADDVTAEATAAAAGAGAAATAAVADEDDTGTDDGAETSEGSPEPGEEDLPKRDDLA